MNDEYDYTQAGFNDFLTRPLVSLISAPQQSQSRQVNFEQSQITGALGDILTIGNIQLDGVSGQITVSDGENVRVIVGRLDG